MFLLLFLSLLSLFSLFLFEQLVIAECRNNAKPLIPTLKAFHSHASLWNVFGLGFFDCCLAVNFADFFLSATVLLPHSHCHRDGIFFLSVCFFHRSLTSNLPNVNLPNVNLPKVPNLPVNIPLGIPQMPAFSAPSWMAAIYDAECVFSSRDLISSK